jgi:hypothetical protein
VLGDHAAQAGSAIDAGRFRFDFPHFEAVGREQVAEVEERVNERIAADPEIATVETSQEEARAMGATRCSGRSTASASAWCASGTSPWSCAAAPTSTAPRGRHLHDPVEGSIAANLRRIEAVTGPEAFAHLSRERLVAEQVAQMLKVGTDEVVERVTTLHGAAAGHGEGARPARQEALLRPPTGCWPQPRCRRRPDRRGDGRGRRPRRAEGARAGPAQPHRQGSSCSARPAEDGQGALVAAVSADLVDGGSTPPTSCARRAGRRRRRRRQGRRRPGRRPRRLEARRGGRATSRRPPATCSPAERGAAERPTRTVPGGDVCSASMSGTFVPESAISDPDRLVATPLDTIPGGEDLSARLVSRAREEGCHTVVIGLPLALSGRDTDSTRLAGRRRRPPRAAG